MLKYNEKVSIIFCILIITALTIAQTKKQEGKVKINITSDSFKESELIPSKYTCDDKNISPQLAWDKPSDKIKTFAIIAEDPDAPGGNFIHWVAFNIPANVLDLPEDVTPIKNIPEEVLFGTNNFGHIGYGGPCPPSGTHRYFFRIYGLDSAMHLEAGSEKMDLINAMKNHIIAEGELMGKYSRKK